MVSVDGGSSIVESAVFGGMVVESVENGWGKEGLRRRELNQGRGRAFVFGGAFIFRGTSFGFDGSFIFDKSYDLEEREG
ncbi:hypothetical protein QJS10_CPB17g02563 [Acorus calamus]|uniref:Uncharacterized protein n=1 Tax=Acorus calamus TaxID=4465 RepID=A0AAV9CW09_ACOCL|nr:hypothetical protein QJS10_CPB17g02563 [Acorus calamus]